MKKIFILMILITSLVGFGVTTQASAAGTANHSGTITTITVDAASDHITVNLNTMPTSPISGCSSSTFVLPGTTPQNRYFALFSALMTAKDSAAPVSIRYFTDPGSCTLLSNGSYYLTLTKVWFQ